MSELDISRRKALEAKLKSFVACVVAKAAEDPVFARELEGVLLSDELRRKIASPFGKSKKSLLNPVAVLHHEGEDGLRMALERLTTDELRQIARDEAVFKGRDLKAIPRLDLVEELVAKSQRRLTQGEGFLRSS